MNASTPKETFGKDVAVETLNVFEWHLDITYLIDNKYRSFSRIYYPGGELRQLAEAYPAVHLRKIYCNIALFEGLKYCLTFPKSFDISVIADGLSPDSLIVFKTIAANAWTQHMYENDVKDYWGPELICNNPFGKNSKIPRHVQSSTYLCSNGGGKDSFLFMKIMEKARLPYACFQHARSEYGLFDKQHFLQSRILKHLPKCLRQHKISVLDDYTDGTFASCYAPKLTGQCMLGHPCQVGWPEMIFESLPFILLNGYRGFILGNERSAETGQTNLPGNHREVNHQWIKSNQASRLISTYINENLISEYSIFSLIKPIYDHRIYRLMKDYPEVLPLCHSCNVDKPWCKKCAKCAYVWVNLIAVFGHKLVDKIFGTNLFDDPDLQQYWKELLGLNTHNAFECVGEVWETRLAFYRCIKRKCRGRAITLFRKAFLAPGKPPIDWKTLEDKYNRIYSDHLIPPDIFKKIKRFL